MRTMSAARLAATIGAALVAALVVTGVVWSRQDDDPSALPRGPMVVPLEHGYSLSMARGSTFTDGFEILRLKGDRPAVIESVEITADSGVEMTGAMLAPPPRENAAVQVLKGWPPTHDALDESTFVDAVDATIQPLSREPMGYELLIGLRVTGEGFLVRQAVTVTYRIEDTRYQVVFPAVISICTGPKYEKPNGQCPFPEEAKP